MAITWLDFLGIFPNILFCSPHKPKNSHLFIQQKSSAYYAPGTALSTEDTIVNETNMITLLIKVGETDNNL